MSGTQIIAQSPVIPDIRKRIGGLAHGSYSANKIIFQFDGRAVADLLGVPGVHRLLFQFDILGDRGAIMYVVEADLTLH